jgi:uncharacterized protein YegP (UPF0339 family)
MPAYFALNQDSNNEYYFHFMDSDDELVLLSSQYPNKESAEAAIKDVQLNSLMSQQLAGGKTPDGEMFFVIKGSDGHVLVKSALYTSQMKMDNALHCVKDNACVADVKDLTSAVAQ